MSAPAPSKDPATLVAGYLAVACELVGGSPSANTQIIEPESDYQPATCQIRPEAARFRARIRGVPDPSCNCK